MKPRIPATHYTIHCSVPFCVRVNRTHSPGEWICAEHWRLVPWSMKMVFWRARRRLANVADRESADFLAAYKSFWRIWERLKRQAIEAAAGIDRGTRWARRR